MDENQPSMAKCKGTVRAENSLFLAVFSSSLQVQHFSSMGSLQSDIPPTATERNGSEAERNKSRAEKKMNAVGRKVGGKEMKRRGKGVGLRGNGMVQRGMEMGRGEW